MKIIVNIKKMHVWHSNVDEIPTKTSLNDEYTACNNLNIAYVDKYPIHHPLSYA
jgi:hypothetical protein